MRHPDVIRNEIAAAKERFDRLVYGQFYDRYSRASRLRQWQMLQEEIAPLVAELAHAEAYAIVQRERQMRKEYLVLRKRRVMKGKAA